MRADASARRTSFIPSRGGFAIRNYADSVAEREEELAHLLGEREALASGRIVIFRAGQDVSMEYLMSINLDIFVLRSSLEKQKREANWPR